VKEDVKETKRRKIASLQIGRKETRKIYCLASRSLIYVLPKAAENEGIRVLTGW